MNYHNITKNDMLNGDGLRVVLWVAGCQHHCKGCQNPQTWDINSGILFDEKAKEEIFLELQHDYISGITFSGGDPLHPMNIEEITKLAIEIKEKFPTKTIWIYTGYLLEQIYDKHKDLFQVVDVVVDGRFVLNEKNNALHWKGSGNQRVIHLKEFLKNN